MVRPGGFELPTFWFVANGVKILNALFGVAYGLETPFLHSISCTQSCTQNRLISNSYLILHRFNPKAKFGLTATTEDPARLEGRSSEL
jgi:hypothetical protein